MTTLIQISTQPLVHALGWTLLHLCWQGTLVALVLWSVLQVLDGRSSRARYAAACLALGMMVVLPLATFAHLASDEYSMRAIAGGPAVLLDAGMVLQVSAVETSEPWPERIAAALDHALPWIILAWFAGVILFVVRLNVGLLVARRMRSIETTAVPAELQQAFDEIRRRLGVERAVRLMHSALVQAPTVIGWLRPVVLVPASCLTGLSTMQIEAVLAHELAHIRRHDYLVSVLQSVIETLLFYHPAVWWVSKQVRRERECCCDEMAVAVGGDRLAYARALSVLEERRACMPELVLGANGGVLTMRIRRLLGRGGASMSSQLAAGMVLAILVVVAGSYVVTAARAEVNALRLAAHAASPMELEAATPLNALIAEPAVRELKAMLLQPAAAISGTAETNRIGTVYTTWLNQDVLWIITSEERAAFLKLTNDEERDKFIEQFWARRDPPGSPAGSFKAEHYRRIAYSNEHFASESPGCRSDRGRIYILYGTPDSIMLPPGDSSTKPSPIYIWHYHSADGRGIDMMFEDTCQCGKLLLVSQDAAGVPVSGVPASQSNGIIAGSIVDLTGAVVSGAKVTSTNTDNGIQTRTETDNLGKYYFSSLPPGNYNVEVEAKGYQRLLQENVIVGSGKTYSLNLKLTGGPGAQTLTITLNNASRPYGQPNPTFTSSVTGALNGDTFTITYSTPATITSPVGTYPIHTTISGANISNYNVTVKPGTLTITTATGAPTTQAAPGGPVRISSGTASGMVLSKVDPVYPAIAKAAHVQGSVILHAIISKDGTIKSLSVISGNGMLVDAARDAVSQWKFKPYLLNGQPTEVETSITENFSLAGSAQATIMAGDATDGVRQIGGDVKGPVPIYQSEPEYTKEGKKAKVQGIVTVGLVVDEHGVPQNVHVLRGMGIGPDGKPDPKFKKAWRKAADGMNQSAVDAVTEYRFKPATENGRTVAVYLNVEVNFEIF
jgi:TonB family protein